MKRTKTRADANDLAIGRRILAIRKSLGLSQSVLGDRLGVSYQQVQKYEKGKDRFSVSQLMRFSHALDVSLGDLLPGIGLGGATVLSEPDPATIELVRSFAAVRDAEARRCILRVVEAFSNRE